MSLNTEMFTEILPSLVVGRLLSGLDDFDHGPVGEPVMSDLAASHYSLNDPNDHLLHEFPPITDYCAIERPHRIALQICSGLANLDIRFCCQADTSRSDHLNG